MQSTILAPLAFHTQALISKEPSCPFPGYTCPKPSLARALEYADLFSIRTMILQSPERILEADSQPALELKLDAKPWRVYEIRSSNTSSYASVPRIPLELIPVKDWRERFWQWFIDYKADKPQLIVDLSGKIASQDYGVNVSQETACSPRVKVEFNKLTLETNCPNQFHILKFAYHDSWKSDGGESIFLTSPGFIGMKPQKEKTILTFGQHTSWALSSWISLLAWLGLFALAFRPRLLAHLRILAS